MMNEQLNTRIYHYMVPVAAENGQIIGYNDVLIKNAKEYLELLKVAEINRQNYLQELQDQEIKRQREAAEKERKSELEKAEERRLKAESDYRRQYSYTNFLTAYNYLKLLVLEGRTDLNNTELDGWLEAVNNGELIEKVVNSSEELKLLFARMEAN